METFIRNYGVNMRFPSFDVQDATFYPKNGRFVIYTIRSVVPEEEVRINKVKANGKFEKRITAQNATDLTLSSILRIEYL